MRLSGRQTLKKGCLLADTGIWSCQSSSRATLPARHSETEAMYPMKYSPKLSLPKKEGRARGRKKCAAIDRWRVPKMLLMSGLLSLLYKREGGKPAGGPLNVHTNVPLTARRSPEQRPPISKNTLLIRLHSRNIQTMLLQVLLTLLILALLKDF